MPTPDGGAPWSDDELDATMPVPRTEPTPADPGGRGRGGGSSGGGPGGLDDGAERWRRALFLGGGALLLVLLTVIVVLLVTGGSRDRTPGSTSTSSSSTSSSSTSTSSTSTSSTSSTSTSTTSTTKAASNPVITLFTATPSPAPCPSTSEVSLNWTTQNAVNVDVSIDGPGKYATYGPSGPQLVPFSCGSSSHSYTLTARGASGQTVSQTIVVNATTGASGPSGPTGASG